jgi:hypothetical protein
MKFTIILRDDGIERVFQCGNYYDALILRDALEIRYSPDVIELWENDNLLTRRLSAV